MRAYVAIVFLLSAAPAYAQQASVTGTVSDSVTRRPLDGVRVVLSQGDVTLLSTVTDGLGAFTLAPVQAGRYGLTFTRLDYAPHRVADLDISARQDIRLSILLEPRAFVINPVIVSASRSEQKALEAPASVSVIDTRAIEERTALTAVDHVFAVPGLDVATTGITQHEVVARGFNNVASGALLVMTDSRFAHVPSLRINVFNFIPLTDEDVERVEVVRGPGSALYGPNSATGVFHLMTRSPFEFPGLSATLAGGERLVFRGGLRWAVPLSRKLAFKVSAQYLRGREFSYTDPEERAKRLVAIAEGADPDTLLIGRRDKTVERASGEVRLDWRPSARTSLVTTAGANQALRNTELTPLGAAQVKNWRYSYVQSRLNRGRLFAQAYVNLSDAGETFLLRTGMPIIDKSLMLVAQAQHGALVGRSVDLTYGVDYQRTVPRTDGTINGRNEDDDEMDEVGAYLHGVVTLSPDLRLIAAARADYHSALPNVVFSPRAALVYQLSASQTFRLTYNRAFSTPTTNQLFTDIVGDVLLSPVPMPVRLVGVPATGYSFRRDCNGDLCVRSPYTPAVLGDETTWLPKDATLLWPTIVDTLYNRGIDIRGIPQPTAAEVGTILARLNTATAQFDPITNVTDIPELRPTITNTIELGYRAILDDWLTVGFDFYRGWKNDFVGGERIETPNVFFDQATLSDYLANFMPAGQAADLADLIATVPAGTVTPQEARDPYDLLVTYRNFGKLYYWGADVELGAALGRTVQVYGTYSWTSQNLFDVMNAVGEPDTIPLNAPMDHSALAVRYRNDRLGLYGEVRGRAVAGFPMQSGVYAGQVEAYGVLDASIGYRLRRTPHVVVTLSATNLTNNRHQEFIGAPPIGRLVLVRLRAEL
jgi:outer membrane receptor for ferrienterochelin and colicins